jgi:hypothetical protein
VYALATKISFGLTQSATTLWGKVHPELSKGNQAWCPYMGQHQYSQRGEAVDEDPALEIGVAQIDAVLKYLPIF